MFLRTSSAHTIIAYMFSVGRKMTYLFLVGHNEVAVIQCQNFDDIVHQCLFGELQIDYFDGVDYILNVAVINNRIFQRRNMVSGLLLDVYGFDITTLCA